MFDQKVLVTNKVGLLGSEPVFGKVRFGARIQRAIEREALPLWRIQVDGEYSVDLNELLKLTFDLAVGNIVISSSVVQGDNGAILTCRLELTFMLLET